MAGDWIKMRSDLQRHPKVVRMSSALRADRFRIIGGLHAVWCLFDEHSEDGQVEGYTTEAIDDLIGWPGFCAAMAVVQWLEVSDGFCALPRFDEHNGQSAKRRAMETQRKRRERAEEDARLSALDADKKRSRTDKREEKKEDTFSGNSVGDAGASHTAEPKAHPLPADWQLPRAWGEWAMSEYPHWTADDVRLEADKFRDHWRGKSGKDSRKADWPATWRNWCRSDIAQRAHPLRAPGVKPGRMTDEERAAFTAGEADKARRLLFGDAEFIEPLPQGITHEAV
jgi:hypothetical protein